MFSGHRLAPAASTRSTARYHVLDVFRGLAALSVLIWHYQHFYLATPGATFPEALRRTQPFFAVLSPFYEHGYLAVNMFWLMSGFVFAAVYVGRLSKARDFAINRLARLYPLHLLTLLLVACLQMTSLAVTGHWEIYGNNDAAHFGLQLFMASNWFTATTFSFNGPIWSVSIEVVFYVLFWISLPFIYERGVVGPLIVAMMFWSAERFIHSAQNLILDCGFYFFLGVACCIIGGTLRARTLGFTALLIGCLGMLMYRVSPGHVISTALPMWLFAALMAMVALEPLLGRAFGRLAWIGDSTYGIYLWHVPLQIALLIVLDGLIGSRSAVRSPYFFVVFVAVVVMVARLSFLFYERPMRRWVRGIGSSGSLTTVEPVDGLSAP